MCKKYKLSLDRFTIKIFCERNTVLLIFVSPKHPGLRCVHSMRTRCHDPLVTKLVTWLSEMELNDLRITQFLKFCGGKGAGRPGDMTRALGVVTHNISPVLPYVTRFKLMSKASFIFTLGYSYNVPIYQPDGTPLPHATECFITSFLSS